MSFWKRLFGYDATPEITQGTEAAPVVNPATGLPMIDNSTGGMDVAGNPYGQDVHQHHARPDSQDWTPFNHNQDSF